MTTPLRQLKNTARYLAKKHAQLQSVESLRLAREAKQTFVHAFNAEFRAKADGVEMVNCPNDDMVMFVRDDGRPTWHCSGCGKDLPIVNEPLTL